MTYRDKLQHPNWQKKRLEILERDDFTCLFCGDKETQLHVHHLSYKNDPWEVENKELQTLCKHCHKGIEYLKSTNLEKFIPPPHLRNFVVKDILKNCYNLSFIQTEIILNLWICDHDIFVSIISINHLKNIINHSDGKI